MPVGATIASINRAGDATIGSINSLDGVRAISGPLLLHSFPKLCFAVVSRFRRSPCTKGKAGSYMMQIAYCGTVAKTVNDTPS